MNFGFSGAKIGSITHRWIVNLYCLDVIKMATKIMLKHPATGMLRKGYYGFSWTYFFFGWFVPLFRNELGTAALHLLFSVCTLGVWQIVLCFLYNKQFMTRMLVDKGYVLADSSTANEMARMKLGIVAPASTSIPDE